MPKAVKIIGVCPFCHRDVGHDMRPINILNSEDMEKLLAEMDVVGDVQTSTSSVNGEDPVQSNLAITFDNKEISLSSAAPFTETILDIVKCEFERPNTSDSVISEAQANLIVTMLMEEQHTYNSFLNTTLKKKQRRRKQ